MLYGVMAETYAFDEYNQLNQYESVTFDSQTQPMDYDLNGNVIQYDDKTFTYDYLNRMLTAVDGSTLDESYAYDSMGRRVLADAEGTQTVYVYDGTQVIAEYSLVSQTLTLKKWFIYGPGIDEPVCMITYSGGSESGRYFYHFDGQGNVIALSNSSGNVVEEYEYDVYGLVSVQSLGQTWDRSQYGNPYLFTGRRWDSTTGLYYYRMRDYSPALGRFLQPDPIGYADGMNLYTYCGNNPLNFIDPWGLKESEQALIDYFVSKYNLSKDIGRRALHNAITKQGMTVAEIEEEAARIASQGGKYLNVGGGATKSGWIKKARVGALLGGFNSQVQQSKILLHYPVNLLRL